MHTALPMVMLLLCVLVSGCSPFGKSDETNWNTCWKPERFAPPQTDL